MGFPGDQEVHRGRPGHRHGDGKPARGGHRLGVRVGEFIHCPTWMVQMQAFLKNRWCTMHLEACLTTQGGFTHRPTEIAQRQAFSAEQVVCL